MDYTENFLRGKDTAEKVFTMRKLSRMADTGDRDGSEHGLMSQDEGNEIKREFLSEFSPEPPSSNSSSSLLTVSPRFKVLEGKYERAKCFLDSLGELAGQAKEELCFSKFPEWEDPMIPEIEELLIKCLFVTYQVAIRKILICGYSKEIAECAVMRSQLLHELQKNDKESKRKINLPRLKKDLPQQKDESQGKYVAQDKKDERILAAVSQLQALQEEFEGWKDWTHMKVYQVTRTLTAEQAEQKALRLEKKEAEKFIKKKQNLLENTNSRLEEENFVLKKNAEDAKEKELQEAGKLEKAVVRKREALKKCKSIKSEKASLQDELMALKSEISILQNEMKNLKAVFNQSEVKRGDEEREKMKLLKRVETRKRKRERMESVAKVKEEKRKEIAKKWLEEHKDKMTKIEDMMAVLKLE